MLEMMNTLNAAFCEHYARTCPADALHLQWHADCQHVAVLAEQIRLALRNAGAIAPGALSSMCHDKFKHCSQQAADGECKSNPSALLAHDHIPL